MSIHHYSQRGNRRRGINPKAQALLLTILAVAILMQILYPLLSGEALRVVTIATVYWGAAAMSLHAFLAFGPRYAFTYLSITLVYAFVIEEIGVRTGWPFGQYSYDASLGPKIGSVSLVVPFAWAMMVHPLLIASRRVGKNWVFIYGGFALMAWDLFLDPQMVASGRWSWTFTGAHIPFQPEIPLSNAFGWLFAGMGLMGLLHQVLPRDRRKISAGFGVVDFFLAWSWFSGVIANFFFFHRPGVALFGGLIYGVVLAPYAFSRWLGRP